MNSRTPIYKYTSTIADINLYIKREDLLPFSFGGNKVRIAEEFFEDMISKGKNCMVGYGNARSNLTRALSNLCKLKSIPCHIISPNDDDGNRYETSNSILARTCGAAFHMCSKSKVAEKVESVLADLHAAGLKPYYIYGNKFGEGNKEVPVRAYVKCYKEISDWSLDKIEFQYIFHATGTGMTQSGLLAGKHIYNGKEKIIGISVARPSEVETKIIKNYLDSFYRSTGISCHQEDICVVDDFLCGGYAKYNSDIVDNIRYQINSNGLPLDPVYTGKAFYGMQEYIKQHGITGNVLFIHTGGIPLFFDNIQLLERGA